MARRAARAGPVQAHYSKRENIFDSGGVFAGCGGQQHPGVRTFVHDAANLGASEGIFQVGRRGERIHYSIGKFFGEDALEAGSELFAGDAPGGARRIGEPKFQAPRLGRAEALHFQDDAVAGGFFYAQNAAGEIALFGPEMHQGIFAFEAKFEVQRGELGKPFAALADLDAAGRGEVAERSIQGRPIVCRRIQRHTVMGLLCRFEKFAAAAANYCKFRPVTRMDGYS